MKQLLLIPFVICTFGPLRAQTLVGTNPTPRQVVLEKFTKTDCANCPDGTAKAEALYDAYPGKVNLINVYQWSSATAPPVLQTSFSGGLYSNVHGASFPCASVNRQVWPGYVQGNTNGIAPYYVPNSYGTVIYRRGFMAAGTHIITQGGTSPVNIGVKTTWNETNRELTVNVELYYTADEAGNNEIHVALLQNNIIGFQAYGGSNYNHKHVLRHLLTGLNGQVITTPSSGQLITKTYVYTVPASYGAVLCNIDNCDITVFVTKNTHKDIHTGITCKAKNGQATTTPLNNTGINENLAGLSDVGVFPNPLNENSVVRFSLESTRETRIELYDVLGSLIVSQELGNLNAGTHHFSLDFICKEAVLARGVYLLKVSTGLHSTTVKITR